jgi:hypothetical protein
MTDNHLEKLLEKQDREIKHLQQEIKRLLEEIHIIERQQNREDDH